MGEAENLNWCERELLNFTEFTFEEKENLKKAILFARERNFANSKAFAMEKVRAIAGKVVFKPNKKGGKSVYNLTTGDVYPSCNVCAKALGTYLNAVKKAVETGKPICSNILAEA